MLLCKSSPMPEKVFKHYMAIPSVIFCNLQEALIGMLLRDVYRKNVSLKNSKEWKLIKKTNKQKEQEKDEKNQTVEFPTALWVYRYLWKLWVCCRAAYQLRTIAATSPCRHQASRAGKLCPASPGTSRGRGKRGTDLASSWVHEEKEMLWSTATCCLLCYCQGNPHGQRASAHIWSCHRALNLWNHSTKYREMYAGTYFHKASQPDDPGIIIGSLAYTVVFQLTIPLSLLPSLLWHISYSGSSYEPRISQKRIPGEA